MSATSTSSPLACFNESQPTDYTGALLDVQSLRSGESVDFTTELPVDPTTCASFAIYAIGIPEAESADSQSPKPARVAVPGDLSSKCRGATRVRQHLGSTSARFRQRIAAPTTTIVPDHVSAHVERGVLRDVPFAATRRHARQRGP